MKPILLTMQAFGSYGEKTEIDFQKGGDFFLISGDTGSGKSTIFDAMMFALYGEVSTVGINKDKKKNEKLDEMLSQFVDVQKTKPYASLIFTAYQHGQEETYTVRRTPRYTRPAKRGDAKLQDERETVELLMPDGSQYPGKLSETNRKIEELVGLTADQFRKVVMIAQGEFMDFLRAGSKEKTELLRDLLKTDYYYQLSERLKTLAKEKNTAAKTQRAKLSLIAANAVTEGLPEEDAQALEAAKGTVITAKELQPEQVDALCAMGIQYSRTVESTGSFALPQELLRWKPTCHHNDKLLERAEKFLHVPGYEKMPLFYIWGHSFEFERENTWPLMEQLAEKLHGAQDIWYATNGQIADYLTALRSTRESADGKRLYNPSAQPIWFVADGKVRVAEPGKLCEI